MTYYRLYYFNDSNRICAFDETVCDGDREAIRFARRMQRGRAAELWNRERFVLRLEACGRQQAAAGPDAAVCVIS